MKCWLGVSHHHSNPLTPMLENRLILVTSSYLGESVPQEQQCIGIILPSERENSGRVQTRWHESRISQLKDS